MIFKLFLELVEKHFVMIHLILYLCFFLNSDEMSESSVAEHVSDIVSASFLDSKKIQSLKVAVSSSQER